MIKYETLDTIFDIKNGYTPSKAKNEYWDNGTIPWFRMEDIRENGRILEDAIQHITERAVKGELFKKNSIILATSATIGEHALVKVDYLSNQRFSNFTLKKEFDKNSINFFYYMFFKVDEFCKNNLNEGNFSTVDSGKLKNYKIPLPPLHVQEKIVSILDRFDAFCNDLTAGLPAEIEARKKQYEYYRDKLLTFS